MTTRRKPRRVKQPHEVRHLNGKPINWRKPPAPNKMCSWSKRTTSGKQIKGSFWTLCHLNRLNNLSLKKFGVEIQIIQPDWNTGVAASAGTHDFDSTWDIWIPGVDPYKAQRFLRANGFGCWVRKPPLFGWHIHGFSLPRFEGQVRSDDFRVMGLKVGVYVDGGYSTRGGLVTSSQLADYVNEAFGLSGQHTPGSDNTWYPANKGATVFNLHAYVERRARLMAA